MNELKIALAQAEEDKKALSANLVKVSLEKEQLVEQNEIKMIAIEESVRRYKKEEGEKLEAQERLRGARDQLQKCNLKKKEALKEASRWRFLCEEARRSDPSSEWFDRFQELEKERDAIMDLLKDYQRALGFEQNKTDELKNHLQQLERVYRQVNDESKHWEEQYVGLLARVREHEVIKDMNSEIQRWKTKFSELSELVHQAVNGVPKALRKAELEVHILDTPPEIVEFIKLGRALITEFRRQTQEIGIGKKRRRPEDLQIVPI